MFSLEGVMLDNYFSEEYMSLNACVYIHLIETVERFWTEGIARYCHYILQQDGALYHTAEKGTGSAGGHL